jgi:glycosyltransferase involved in cell wall biosynthesis
MDKRLRIAMIGDRGIPARYSGFSTLVEEVSTRLVAHHGMDVTVYCRTHYFDTHPPVWRGVNLTYLAAAGGKSFESLRHSSSAILHAARRPPDAAFDLAFVVDPGNGPLTWPFVLKRLPFVIHTDGLGWQRTKWSALQRRYYRWAEWVSARAATGLVCDSVAMQDYYRESYRAPSAYIPYGGEVGDAPDDTAPASLGLEPGGYHLVVARLEPENNVDLIIREYKASRARLPLVYAGGARYESAYSRSIFAEGDARVKCVGPVYESARLNGLYKHCASYIHGHQVGGTNPSLLRAMAAGAACVPIDVVFHREVLGDAGVYFAPKPGALGALIETLEADPARCRSLGAQAAVIAAQRFRWDAVAAGYAELFRHLHAAQRAGTRQPTPPAHAVYRPEAFWDGVQKVSGGAPLAWGATVPQTAAGG